MEWHLQLPGTSDPPIRISKSFWLGRVNVSQRGRELPRSGEPGRPFVLSRRDGSQVRIVVKNHALDLVPQVSVDGQEMHLARPLTRGQYVFGALPLVLIAFGGAIGGAIGGAGMIVNLRVLRSDAALPLRVLGVLGVTLGCVVGWAVLVTMLQAAIGGPR